MVGNEDHKLRVLAIDPTRQGFGFVIFEGKEDLVDWGLPHVWPPDQKECLRRMEELLKWYEPHVLVIEDTEAPDCRRRLRVRRLLKAVTRLARQCGVEVEEFSRAAVRQVFADSGAVTKQEIASVIASCYKELAPRLPPPRKIWMAEDLRMGLFGAAALAWSYFKQKPAGCVSSVEVKKAA